MSKLVTMHGLRNEVLSKLIDGERDTDIQHYIVCNVLPIRRVDEDISVITDFSDYMDLDGLLPIINEDTPDDIKHFLDVTLTNIVNRHLEQCVDWLRVVEFIKDRAELIEYIRSDDDIKDIITKINFNSYYCNSKLDNDIIAMYTDVDKDNITYLALKNPLAIKTVLINQIPETLYTGNTNEVYKITEHVLPYNTPDSNSDLLLYTDTGDSFLMMKSVYGYNTIRKYSILDYMKLTY